MTTLTSSISAVYAQYNFWAGKNLEKGKNIKVPKGIVDVLRVVHAHKARSSHALWDRSKNLSSKTFVRRDGNYNFDRIVMWILSNVNLSTRSFSKEGTQAQIASSLNIHQSTVSRLLSKMIQLGMLRHAFIGDNSPTNPKSGCVRDGDGLNFNNVYVVTDDFGPLVAGPTAGNKMNAAFQEADEKAIKQSGQTLMERLLVVRGVLFEGTIARRLANLKGSKSLASTLKKVTDRSRAIEIIRKRAEKRGELRDLSLDAISKLLNYRLNHAGWGG